MRILNDLIYDDLLHFGKAGNEFPELLLGDNANGAIRHALDRVRRIRIEDDLYLADQRALLYVTEEYALSGVNILEDLTHAGPGYNEMPEVLIVLPHDLLLWLIKANADPL